MKKIFHKHKILWLQKSFSLNVFLGVVLLCAGLLATYFSNNYTLMHASNRATDLLLDNLPVVNTDIVFNEGAIIFLVILISILVYEPRRIPFVLKSIAIFILVRSLFMMMTHLAAPLDQITGNPDDFMRKISSGDDLFFSGHTGLPFLLAWIFWDKKYFRYFFIFCTLVGATAVILGHLHYSIDVFSALFISFGIFHIAKKLFYKDHKLLLDKE
jgi:divalent metal cation (Fe/Co/Zn/Cd) transporter